jgi:hypothetical protein
MYVFIDTLRVLHAYMYIHMCVGERERAKERKSERARASERESKRAIERERERERVSESERAREGESKRERERERERPCVHAQALARIREVAFPDLHRRF